MTLGSVSRDPLGTRKKSVSKNVSSAVPDRSKILPLMLTISITWLGPTASWGSGGCTPTTLSTEPSPSKALLTLAGGGLPADGSITEVSGTAPGGGEPPGVRSGIWRRSSRRRAGLGRTRGLTRPAKSNATSVTSIWPGASVAVGVGISVAVGVGVAVAVSVGIEVPSGVGVAVGVDVGVGGGGEVPSGVGVGGGVGVGVTCGRLGRRRLAARGGRGEQQPSCQQGRADQCLGPGKRHPFPLCGGGVRLHPRV